MTGSAVELLGEEIAQTDLTLGRAVRVAEFVRAHEMFGAKLVACRRNQFGHEVIVLDVAGDIVQRPTIDIRDVERLAVVFGDENELPAVLALREDFPLAPHTNDTPLGMPVSLCLYREPWSEIRIHWTPGTFVQRIRWWLDLAAEGDLYGGENPIEPLFYSSPFNIVVSRPLFEECFETECERSRLVVIQVGDTAARMWMLQREGQPDPLFRRAEPLKVTFLSASTPVITDGRVRLPPRDLGELVEFAATLGFDLAFDLRAQLRTLMSTSELHDTQFALLLAARIAADASSEPRHQLIGFLSEQSIKDAAIALGEYEAPESDVLPGFVINGRDESKRGQGIGLMPTNVVLALDPRGAAELSGKAFDERKVALVGGGAIGSALFDMFTRQGFGRWSIVDEDFLAGHNLARHSSHRGMLGVGKARALSLAAAAITGEGAKPDFVEADLTDPGDALVKTREVLDEAELIIDASASAAVARTLSTDGAKARRISAFLLGDAEAIVLLSEDSARTIRLDDLEATLVAAAIHDERLGTLFHRLPTQVATPASCRAPTSRAPWSRIAGLAGFAAESIRRGLDHEGASIVVARWREGDGIDVIRVPVSTYEQRTLGDWSVRISGQVLADLKDRRAKALPSETGGMLIGSTDSWNHVVHIAAHESDFVDSEGTPVSFQRGLSGLPDRLKLISQRTHGALAYIGEWHSHPPGTTARPSGDDIAQLSDIAMALLVEDRPAISVIVAEQDHNILVGRLHPS